MIIPNTETKTGWAERAEILEDAAFRGEPMPEDLNYPEQLLFLKFRYLYAYARIVQMPPEQGQKEKQQILVDYLANCTEYMVLRQVMAEQEGGG